MRTSGPSSTQLSRPLVLSRRKRLRQKARRQQRWLLFWLLTGFVLVCCALYPIAGAIAHAMDQAEKPPFVDSHAKR